MDLVKSLLGTFLFVSLSVPAIAQDTSETVDTTEQTFEISLEDNIESFAQTYYYNYGRVRVNRSASAVFYITNNGRSPIYINDVDIDGDAYSGGDNCPRLLFAGQRCRARVTFRPPSVGQHFGEVEFELSGSQDVKVELRGRGVRNNF